MANARNGWERLAGDMVERDCNSFMAFHQHSVQLGFFILFIYLFFLNREQKQHMLYLKAFVSSSSYTARISQFIGCNMHAI